MKCEDKKEYRIITRMTATGEEFHPEYRYADGRTIYWEDLLDTRWDNWCATETEARALIANHKTRDAYEPRIIYVD